MEAQQELAKMVPRPSCSAPPHLSLAATHRAEDDDLDFLENIPLQGFLGACFEENCKKESRPSTGRLSAASTMASLGGYVPAMCATTSAGSSCEDRCSSFSLASPPPTMPRLALASPRPTLPSFDVDRLSGVIIPPTRRLDLRTASPRPTLCSVSSSRSDPSPKQFDFMRSCMPPQQPSLPQH